MHALAEVQPVMLPSISRPTSVQHGWLGSKPRHGVWRPSLCSSQKHAGPSAQVRAAYDSRMHGIVSHPKP